MIEIRRLQPSDVNELSAINAAITLKPGQIDFERIINTQAPRDGDASFVAERDGKVVGYLIGYILAGSFGIEKSAWIAMLGVNPDYMGQGIGEKLARTVFDFFQRNGIRDIYTSVRWDSTDLLSFFKTLGFNRSNHINLRKTLE